MNDSAIKKLSSARALHRLNLASGGAVSAAAGAGGAGGSAGGGGDANSGGQGAVSPDPHPHITALATVLGEASKLMARLAESSLGEDVEEPVARLLHEDSKTQVCAWACCVLQAIYFVCCSRDRGTCTLGWNSDFLLRA